MRLTVILAIAAILTPAALSAQHRAPVGRDRSRGDRFLGRQEKEKAREAEGRVPEGRARHWTERSADEILRPSVPSPRW